MDQILVVFLNDWYQNCCQMAKKKLGWTHYFHGKNCLVVEMALKGEEGRVTEVLFCSQCF